MSLSIYLQVGSANANDIILRDSTLGFVADMTAAMEALRAAQIDGATALELLAAGPMGQGLVTAWDPANKNANVALSSFNLVATEIGRASCRERV